MFFLTELEYLKTNVNAYKSSIIYFLNSRFGNNCIHVFGICGKLNIQPGIGVHDVWFHSVMAITIIYRFKNCAAFYWGEFLYFHFST